MARVRNGRGHSRSAATFQRQTVSVSFDSISDQLDDFADRITKDVLAKACYAAAHEVYVEMKMIAPVWTGKVYTYKRGKRAGQVNATPGQLKDAIYHAHNKRLSNDYRQVYDIGVNKRKAPHWYFVEYGTSRMAAKPYIRSAWLNKQQVAMQAAKDVLSEEIGKVMNERVAA